MKVVAPKENMMPSRKDIADAESGVFGILPWALWPVGTVMSGWVFGAPPLEFAVIADII